MAVTSNLWCINVRVEDLPHRHRWKRSPRNARIAAELILLLISDVS